MMGDPTSSSIWEELIDQGCWWFITEYKLIGEYNLAYNLCQPFLPCCTGAQGRWKLSHNILWVLAARSQSTEVTEIPWSPARKKPKTQNPNQTTKIKTKTKTENKNTTETGSLTFVTQSLWRWGEEVLSSNTLKHLYTEDDRKTCSEMDGTHQNN